MRSHRNLVVAGVCAALLSACATTSPTADSPSTASAQASAASTPAGRALLDKHALAGKSTVEVIDVLDRMPVGQRPKDLRASVRPDALLLSGDGAKLSLPMPADRFYLSVAPYVGTTHDCFHHSLTTCKGELGGEQVQIRLVEDGTGAVLADGTRTVHDNGFVGFWLPRNTTATLTVTHDGKVATSRVSTGNDDPTCLTTMQLV